VHTGVVLQYADVRRPRKAKWPKQIEKHREPADAAMIEMRKGVGP